LQEPAKVVPLEAVAIVPVVPVKTVVHAVKK